MALSLILSGPYARHGCDAGETRMAVQCSKSSAPTPPTTQKAQDRLHYSRNSFICQPLLAGHSLLVSRIRNVHRCTLVGCSLCPQVGMLTRAALSSTTWAEVQTQLHLMFLSSSVMAGTSVTRPVPMVLLPSLKVKRWPFSKIMGCRKIRLSFKSSPGMASS